MENSKITRQEHLEWCKARAMDYVNQGDYKNAILSMMSDLDKHPDTADDPEKYLGLNLLILTSTNPAKHEAVSFIEGFR